MIKRIFLGLAALVSVAAIVLVVALQRANTELGPLDDEGRALALGQFIKLKDGLTHYDVAGPESGPVVILVHGFSVPYYIWDTTFAALADAGFRVIRYDLFGRGYSDRPDMDYNGVLFERQILNLIDALEIDEPVDVIGLSMGGAVTMRFAANHPALVRKIVLVDPAHEASAMPKWPQPIGSLLLALTYIPHVADGQMTDFVYPENYPSWVEQYRVQMTYEGFRRAIISTIYHFGTEDHLANYRKVQELGLPVKLIWGVEDQTVDISGADTVRAVLDVDFMPVEDAGHLPHIEQPEITNSAIVEYLSDVFEP